MSTPPPHSSPTQAPTPTTNPGIQPPRHSPWGWMITLVILGIGGWAGYTYWPAIMGGLKGGTRDSSMPPKPPVLVQARMARQGDFPIFLNGLGTVTPHATVTIRSRVDGQLMMLTAKEGQLVEQGELLAQIDPRPFNVQLAQAAGQLAKDQATLQNAELDLARYTDAGEAASQQQRDTAKAQVAQLKGTVQMDQAAIANAHLQLTYCNISAPISGMLGLHVIDKGNMVHSSDANGLAVITQLDPISVTFSLPQDNLPLLQQALKAPEPVIVEVYDRTFAPDKPENPLAMGILSALDNQIDPSTGTLKVKASFDNHDQRLFPNQFVNVRLRVRTLKDVILIPTSAVQRTGQITYVYAVVNGPTKPSGGKPEETATTKSANTPIIKNPASAPVKASKVVQFAEMRPIVVLATEGNLTAVSENRFSDSPEAKTGLTTGEMVITDGVDKLQPDAAVIVSPLSLPSPSSQPQATSESAARGKE